MADPRTSYVPNSIDLQSVIIYNAEGRFLDIKPILLEFNIYEDILYNFMRADITVIDSLGLPSNFPMVGQEKVLIQFKTPLEKEAQIHLFYVYAIENRTKNQEKSDVYTLKLCSPEYLKNFNSRVENSYSGLISDMVSKVYSNHLKIGDRDPLFTMARLKEISIDSTSGFNYFIPNDKSALTFINMLSRYAGSYLFYENVDGFHFKDVNGLLTQESSNKFVYGEFNVEEDPQKRAKGLNQTDESKHIIKLEFQKEYDAVDNLSNGLFSQKISTIDPIRKIFTEKVVQYDDEFKALKHLAGNKIISDDFFLNSQSGSHLQHNIVGYIGDYRKVFSELSGSNDKQLYNASNRQDTVDKRHYSLQKLNYINLNITIPGNSTVKAGQVIEVLIPMNSAYKEDHLRYESKFGQEGSAKFLVTAVTHSYNNLEKIYVTHFQAAKDSLSDSVDKMLKVARGTNKDAK